MSLKAADTDDVVPTRPLAETLQELAGFALLACAFTAAMIRLGSTGDTEQTPAEYLEACVEIGAVVVDHLGWGFGVDVPVLLGFYVLVLGGRRAMGERRASAVRRNLSKAAVLLAASLVPAFVLAAMAAAADFRRAGAIFVASPIMTLTIYLAAQLGCFVAFDEDEKLAAARRNRTWTRHRLAAVRSRSGKPVALVLAANAIIGAALGVGLHAASSGTTADLPATVYLVLVASVMGIYAGFGFVRDRYTVKTSFERATGYLLMGMIASVVVAFAMLMLAYGLASDAATLTFTFSFLLVSAFLSSTHPAWTVLQEWTLRGAAARSAAIYLTKRYVKSVRQIIDLQRPRASA